MLLMAMLQDDPPVVMTFVFSTFIKSPYFLLTLSSRSTNSCNCISEQASKIMSSAYLKLQQLEQRNCSLLLRRPRHVAQIELSQSNGGASLQFNALVRGEPLNSGLRNLVSRNQKHRSIVPLYGVKCTSLS